AVAQEEIDIPYTKYVLDNGLTLIVHEDNKAPIVAVNVWYHVGSKNEKTGKTGFAHLFEHLMFNGTENYNDEYFKPFDRVGATTMNGTTNFDRTNYFQNVPKNALDLALWMESDRMGHLLGAVDQARLDEQRDVVKNEKRQGENQPYGRVFNAIFETVFPKGHPYSWLPIGSMEDLDNASLDDVHEWFKTYYGADNAVIAVVGDVKADEVRDKVERYFGDIPAGPPLARYEAWVAKRSGTQRQVMQDRVPQARIYKVWNIPQIGDADGEYLDLVSDALTSGKTSRLYKRLVYEDQLATDVNSFAFVAEIAGVFVVQATAQPGQDLKELEAALDDEMEKFLQGGPTRGELARIKTVKRAEFVRGLEKIGGFGGKSDTLIANEVYEGSPDAYKTTLERWDNATQSDVLNAARKWLSDGVYILEVHPFAEYATKESDVDRSRLPEISDWPEAGFPVRDSMTLSNGLKVVLAERNAIPVVEFMLLLDAGYASDKGVKLGTASLAMNMLDEGTKRRSALKISEELANLGAKLVTGSNLDLSSVSMSALKDNLDDSLDLFADVILNPAFPQADFERLKKQQLARIQREKVTPAQMALRVFPQLLYGKDHAYGIPLTGSGTEASVESLNVADLRAFHDKWFLPNNATLVIVGDTSLEEMAPKLESVFSGWRTGDKPGKNISSVALGGSSTVYLVDRPDSIQSIIFAGHIAPSKSDKDDLAIEAMNEVLGASFAARINLNLREEKNWSYGARSIIVDARGQRPFLVYAPVQSDKTTESMLEIQKELNDIIGSRPATEDEVARAKDKRTLTLPGRWETNAAVQRDINRLVRFGLADDYWNTYPEKVRALSQAEITAAAEKTIHPNNLVWVVVGDRAEIEDKIRAAGFDNIRYMDADGNPLGE
ncbi:MAG: insulinase family protein, partial [Gammaproteobacteria bacterium]|nr:insulinase family protein [Gammaproteobacteria bacterium]